MKLRRHLIARSCARILCVVSLQILRPLRIKALRQPQRTLILAILLMAAVTLAPGASSPDANALQRKLDHIEANGAIRHPDQTPTVFAESEVNAYLGSGIVDLPAGVESVKLQFGPGTISGSARVDFDKALAGARSSNPLLSLFSGVHAVAVITHAHGSGGQGYVHVDSVSLDGVTVPNFVLELFIEKYLQPKYPQIGLDSRFALPDRIDSAAVAEHQVTLIQK